MLSPSARAVRRTGDIDVRREVGERIRRARVAAGLTQEDAADSAGVDWRRWQRLEAGRVNATIRTLVRVSGALGLTFWALLGARAPKGASAGGRTLRAQRGQ